MKLRNLFFASLAMVTFAACSNDDEPAMPDTTPVDASAVNLVITSKAEQTKADDPTKEKGTPAESLINDLKVYVFTSDGAYFAEKTVDLSQKPGSSETENGESNYTVSISGLKTATAYKFVAVANPHYTETLGAHPSLSNLEDMIQEYDAQLVNEAGFTMVGSVDVNDLKTEAAGGNLNAFIINVSRRLAAIELNKVTLDLPDDAGENFTAATATVKQIFLANIRETAKTGSSSESSTAIQDATAKYLHGFKNALTETTNRYENLKLSGTYNSNLAAPINTALTKAENPTPTELTDNRIYAFPTIGTSSLPVVLKIEVEYDHNNTTTTRFYTITVKPTGEENVLKNNTLYQIEATIKGIGSDRPDEVEETAGDVTSTIQVLAWKVKTQNEGNLTD